MPNRLSNPLIATVWFSALCAFVLAPLANSRAELGDSKRCFDGHAPPIVHVFQQAPPPKEDDSASYRYFPASSVVTMQLRAMRETRSSLPMYFFQWANHGPRPVPKSNLAIAVHPGSGISLMFSSIDAADACTIAQTKALLGAQKFELGQHQDGIEMRATVERGDHTDVCLIPTEEMPPRAEGVVLDFEAFDGRTPAQTQTFLRAFADLVHARGRRAILYSDPWNTVTQTRNGIDSTNLRAAFDLYDMTTLLLWGRNREHDIAVSFANQKAMMGRWAPEKVLIVFELNDTSVADAAIVAGLMKANGLKNLMFWRNYAKQGGACATDVNKKIACLAFGRCSR